MGWNEQRLLPTSHKRKGPLSTAEGSKTSLFKASTSSKCIVAYRFPHALSAKPQFAPSPVQDLEHKAHYVCYKALPTMKGILTPKNRGMSYSLHSSGSQMPQTRVQSVASNGYKIKFQTVPSHYFLLSNSQSLLKDVYIYNLPWNIFCSRVVFTVLRKGQMQRIFLLSKYVLEVLHRNEQTSVPKFCFYWNM